MRLLPFLCICSLCLIARTVSADPNDSLRGITAVYLAIPEFGDDAARDGINTEIIRQDVELRLRRAGIAIVSKEGLKDKPLTPWVYVELELAKQRDAAKGLYAVHLSVSVGEFVTLARDPRISTVAYTWRSTSGTSTVGALRLRDIRDALGDKVDEFANAYLAVNPKK